MNDADAFQHLLKRLDDVNRKLVVIRATLAHTAAGLENRVAIARRETEDLSRAA